jgi:drug/metabolite transporter (DMT)-like permease
VSTVLPVGVAVAQGERPGPAVYAGAVICVAATVLVSSGGGQHAAAGGWRDRGRGVALGLASGAAFGLFFLFLRNAGASGALWPALTSRTAGLVIYAAIAVVTGAAPVGAARGWRLLATAIGAGAFDAAANICYLLATRAGLFGPAVVITSLYPAVTVLLARLALGEKMRPLQQAGLALAAGGIILIAA